MRHIRRSRTTQSARSTTNSATPLQMRADNRSKAAQADSADLIFPAFKTGKAVLTWVIWETSAISSAISLAAAWADEAERNDAAAIFQRSSRFHLKIRFSVLNEIFSSRNNRSAKRVMAPAAS